MGKQKGHETQVATNPKHTHQYHRVAGRFSSVWKCADPHCKHFVYAAQDYIVNGRASICWGCGKKFALDEDAMKEDQPRCIDCHHGPMDDVDIDEFLNRTKKTQEDKKDV